MPRIRLAIDQEEQEFELNRQGNLVRMSAPSFDAEVHVIRQEESLLLLEYTDADNVRHTIAVAGEASGDARQWWVDGRILRGKRLRGRATAASSVEGSLSSSIPAVVSQLLVSVGDRVQAGDKLLLLESMKMVIPIQTPTDGIVSQINCAPGESVAAGIPLVEITPDES